MFPMVKIAPSTSPLRLSGVRWYQALVACHDFVMAALALYLAFLLRYGIGGMGPEQYAIVQAGAPLYGLIFLAISTLLGLNKRLWRYVTLSDLRRLVLAVTASVFVALLSMFLLTRLGGVPRSIPLILWPLTLVLVGGSRFAFRMAVEATPLWRPRNPAAEIQIPVLLVGTGPKTSMFIRWARASGFAPYRPIAVLDVTGSAVGHLIEDVPIIGPMESFGEALEVMAARNEKPSWAIVCDMPKAGVMADLARIGREHGVKVSKLPSLTTLQDADTERSVELRPIAIEDLLGRPQIRLDRHAINALLLGRRVLVTGGGGTIGSELCRQILRHRPQELMILDSSEYNLYAIEHELRSEAPHACITPMLVDVRNRTVVMRKCVDYRPELIFHAAALKHVPMVEANPIEAIETNVFGTRNVADAAAACGALGMVLISTDKAVNPTSIMGATKRMAEMYCQTKDLRLSREGGIRFITVRFGNVLGSSGSVVPLFKKQLAKGGPLTVTHPDITRYFMTVHEATQLVLQASAHSLGSLECLGQVMVLDMGKPVKIYELAGHMARLAGLEPGRDIGIEIVGLRPGEKLYEELFGADEAQLPAKVDGINIARSQIPESEFYKNALGCLERSIQNYDVAASLDIMAKLVPGFERTVVEEKTAILA